MKKIVKDYAPVINNYATAYFEFAKENDNLVIDSADAVTLIEAFNESEPLDLGAFMSNPENDSAVQKQILETFQSAVNDDSKKLLNVVFDHNRFYALGGILQVFLDLNDKENKIVRGKVITAKSITDEQLNNIQLATAKRLDANQVILAPEIDESVLGGVKVISNNVVLDGTVANSLDKIRNQLLNDI